MYADLEKIEARGKRKKDKSKGLFSSFGKKDEPEAENSAQVNTEPVQAQPAEPVPEPPKQETVLAPKPVEAPKPAPVVEQPKPQPAPMPVAKPTETAPESKDSGWSPPTGGKLKKAEDDLLAYKRWLNSGFKSGVLTKQQCIDMVKAKEIELGLKPPE
jgi:outer membrane biosynthesis protein TonB